MTEQHNFLHDRGEVHADRLRFLEAIVDGLPGAFYLLNEAGEIVYWNRWLEQITGYSAKELEGLSCLNFVDQSHKRLVEQKVREAFSRGFSNVEALFITKSGERFPSLFSARVIEIGGSRYLAGIGFDVSEQKRIENEFRNSEARYRAIVEDQTEFIVRALPDGTRTFVNGAYCRYFGKTEEELIDSNFYEDVAEEHRQRLRLKIESLSPEQPYAMDQHMKVLPDGSRRWHEWVDRGIFDAEGNLAEVQAVGRDITELRQLSDELSRERTLDPVTELINRAEFERRLGQILIDTQENREEHSLCYLKVSHLRVINSVGGYAAGDAFIRAVSRLISKHLRDEDILARVGGDEFALLMPKCALVYASQEVWSLREAAKSFRFEWDDKSFELSIAAGVISIDETNAEVHEIIRAAASACAIAREQGANSVHVSHLEDSDVRRRYGDMEWIVEINRALESDRFRLAVQRIKPIAEDGRGKDHYEVLLRLEIAEGNLVSPGAFLPAAERFGLSRKLDRWVIEATFGWMARYPRILSELEAISINLSGLSLGDRETLRFIERRITEDDVPPEKICFEITETATIGDFDRAVRFIKAIRKHGCQFSLDDFGSGLSSFAYLKMLPVDYLKIDGLFVKSIVEDATDYSLVKSMNEIGHATGKKTIAEFVENDAILGKLRQIGVDYAQGYGIARPQPIESLIVESN